MTVVESRDISTLSIGVWTWGVALFLWLGVVLAGLGSGVVAKENPLYRVIKENNTVVAAITAVLGVVWSWFFQLADKAAHHVP